MKFSESFWGQFFKEKLKEVAQEAFVHLKNRPSNAVSSPQQNTAPPSNQNDILRTALVRDGFFENSYIATSQVSSLPDQEGYKAGRLVYFVVSGQSGNVGIFCNNNLYFDPQDEYVWPIIQELENIYSDENYANRIGQDEWRQHPRFELIGKPNNPYTDQTDWQHIPSHFKYVEAHHPSFEAPYDQLQLTSPATPTESYQETTVEIEETTQETIIDVIPEEPVQQQETPDYTQVILKPLPPLPDYSKQKQKPIQKDPPIKAHEPTIDTPEPNPNYSDDDDDRHNF